MAGGIAGCCFWTVMFPTDVVKSRVQVCRPDCVEGTPLLQPAKLLYCSLLGDGGAIWLILGHYV